MIEVRWSKGLDPGQWRQWVSSCGGGPLLLPEVHAVDVEPSTLHELAFMDGGKIIGCALAIASDAGGLRRFLGRRPTLHLPVAPALCEVARSAEVRDSLIQSARDAGYWRLHVGASSDGWLAADPALERFRTEAIVEFVLDLQQDVEKIRAGMHKQHRKNVRRAGRENLEVVEDSSVEGLRILREMQLSSSQRAAARSEGFGVREDAFFDRLHRLVYEPGLGHVLHARQAGETVAALAWLSAAGRVLTVRSGSLARGYELRAMYLLYDALIQRAHEEGAVELNCGGVPEGAANPAHPQSGLYEFKQGFGGEAVLRHALDISLGEISG